MSKTDTLHGLIRDRLVLMSAHADIMPHGQRPSYAEAIDTLLAEETLDDLAHDLAVELAGEVDVKAHVAKEVS